MVYFCRPLPPGPKPSKPTPRSMAAISKDKVPRRLPMIKPARPTAGEWNLAVERQKSIRQLAAQIPQEWTLRQRCQAQIAHKITTKLQVPHGPGETTGTQHHCIEVENIQVFYPQHI